MVNKMHTRRGYERGARARGFAVLELVTALFVISVGLFGIMDMYLRVMDGTRVTQQYAAATTVLRNSLETVRARGDAALVPGSYPLPVEDLMMDRFSEAQGTLVVTPSATGIASLREVEARLQWRAHSGRLIEKRLVTLMRVRGTAS